MATLDYYEINGVKYAESTLDADMSETYKKFLPLVKDKGRILDLGCGSGRDSLAFLKAGYDVISVDGSKSLCQYASKVLNKEVICKQFSEINYVDEFDAVWACASLLHVKKIEMHEIFIKIAKALKQGGIFYCSYKYGNTERKKDGREFSDYNENNLNELFSIDLGLTVVEWWISTDVRKDRSSEKWLNIIARKL